MTALKLLRWCQKVRGRTVVLAERMNYSQQFIRQIAHQRRPFPENTSDLFAAAMKRIEQKEAEDHAARLLRVKE